MCSRERVIQLLDEVPEDKVECIIAYMQGIISAADDTRRELKEIPNLWGKDSKNKKKRLTN